MLIGPTDVLEPCATTAGRALDDCEGEFVAACADAAGAVLHVVKDRFAAGPCVQSRAHQRLGDPARLAEIREIIHATPSLGEVPAVRRRDHFLD
jgi:hypothetical protein